MSSPEPNDVLEVRATEIKAKLTKAFGRFGAVDSSGHAIDKSTGLGLVRAVIELPKLTENQLSALTGALSEVARKTLGKEKVDRSKPDDDGRYGDSVSLREVGTEGRLPISNSFGTLGYCDFKNYRDAITAREQASVDAYKDEPESDRQSRIREVAAQWEQKQYASSPDDMNIYFNFIFNPEAEEVEWTKQRSQGIVDDIAAALPDILHNITNLQVPTLRHAVDIRSKFPDAADTTINHEAGTLTIQMKDVADKELAKRFANELGKAIAKRAEISPALAARHVKPDFETLKKQTFGPELDALEPKTGFSLNLSFLAAETLSGMSYTEVREMFASCRDLAKLARNKAAHVS